MINHGSPQLPNFYCSPLWYLFYFVVFVPPGIGTDLSSRLISVCLCFFCRRLWVLNFPSLSNISNLSFFIITNSLFVVLVLLICHMNCLPYSQHSSRRPHLNPFKCFTNLERNYSVFNVILKIWYWISVFHFLLLSHMIYFFIKIWCWNLLASCTPKVWIMYKNK